jgi:type I restriction enzyme M protein
LKAKRGAELEGHYIELLRELGKRKDVLGQFFTKSQNKIQDPAKLYRLIDMIDEVQWVMMGADVKGDIMRACLRRMPKTRSQRQEIRDGRQMSR